MSLFFLLHGWLFSGEGDTHTHTQTIIDAVSFLGISSFTPSPFFYNLTLLPVDFLSLVVFLVWCFFNTQLTILTIFEVKEKVQDWDVSFKELKLNLEWGALNLHLNVPSSNAVIEFFILPLLLIIVFMFLPIHFLQILSWLFNGPSERFTIHPITEAFSYAASQEGNSFFLATWSRFISL